jgi:hypothetical protein
MKHLADGSYQLDLPISFNINADKKARSCWAVADSNGLLYIHLEHNIFLPLERRDNTFCFRVPRSLSDVHLVPLLSKQGTPPPPESPSSNASTGYSGFGGDSFGNNPAAALIFIGALVVAGITVDIATHATTRARAKKRDQQLKIYTPYREAMVWMDSGAITYY